MKNVFDAAAAMTALVNQLGDGADYNNFDEMIVHMAKDEINKTKITNNNQTQMKNVFQRVPEKEQRKLSSLTTKQRVMKMNNTMMMTLTTMTITLQKSKQNNLP